MPTQHAVLIVDADPKGLESLVYGFQGADWRMTACPSPDTAPLLVKASGAEVIVIASRGDHGKTHALMRQLEARDDTTGVPVLVLGPEDIRAAIQEHPNAELLPLPAFVRDVLSASELLVAASTAAPATEAVLQSPASSAKTLSLVRTMNGLGRSGQLRLERNGRPGEILFHHGELTAASVGPLQGMAAVQHLMIWTDGRAELRLRHVPRRGQLHLGPNEFLLELDRFQRDFAHAMRDLGPGSAVYAASPERLKQSGSAVPAEVTPVVRLCNGTRSLSDVIDESPFRVLDTVRILGRLAELGVLTRGDGRPVVVHASEEFLNTARISGAQQAWPMPAPITSPAPAKADLPPGPVGPPLEPRQRRQTLELGTPNVGHMPVAPVVTDTHATPPPVPVGALPAAMAPAISTQPLAAAPPAVLPGPAMAPVSPSAAASVSPQLPVARLPPLAQVLAPPGKPTLRESGAFDHAPALVPAAPVTSTSPTPLLANAPTPPPRRRAGDLTHAAGIIDSSRNARRSQSMRAVGAHPSVVVDSMVGQAVVATTLASPGPVVGGTLQAKPSRRAAPPAGQASIELDPSMTAPTQPVAYHAALRPKADNGVRVTGEMNIPTSGRSARSMGKPTAPAASFHIDPSLTDAGRGAEDRTPRPLHLGSQPAAANQGDSRPLPLARSDSRPIDGANRHQSGSFSTLEADFFAREADLYSQEKTESFADLDDKGGKGAAKGKAGKPGRPTRR